MVIAHNMAAMNAQRQVNIVTDKKQKSTEKLSSGYRINRAADDAAGLSISEKMRKQIRGLNRSAKNIEDGISLVQVADGALAEDSDILQRMNVLAVQAANGTNSASDRADIQKEIDQLTSEIDRIAETTKFNEVHPLCAQKTGPLIAKEKWRWGFPEEFKYKYIKYINDVSTTSSVFIDDIEVKPNESVTLSYICGKGGADYQALKYDLAYAGTFETSERISRMRKSSDNKYYTDRVKESDLKYESDGQVYFLRTNGDKAYVRIDDNKELDAQAPTYPLFSYTHYVYGKREKYFLLENSEKKGDSSGLWLQTGPDTLSGFSLELCDATTQSLGIHDPPIDVSTYENCMDALNRVGDAITKVSSFRSIFGAQQNRLESAYRNNTNTAENTQAAESRIRDTDMADEVVNNAKQEILLQAGQAMISQANQQNQGVLSLLQ